jgi:hypothetical protein
VEFLGNYYRSFSCEVTFWQFQLVGDCCRSGRGASSSNHRFGVQKIVDICKRFQYVQKETETAIQGRTVLRMRKNADELAKLRARCIELKTTLDRRLKENHESLIRIANVNYYIDRLLESRKDTSLQPVIKTKLVAAGIPPCDDIDDTYSHTPSRMPYCSALIFSPPEN